MTFNAIYYDISNRTVHLTELIQIGFEAGVVAMTLFWSILYIYVVLVRVT